MTTLIMIFDYTLDNTTNFNICIVCLNTLFYNCKLNTLKHFH